MKICISTLLLCFFLMVKGQQPMQYSQYMENKYLINPAFAGLEGSLSIFGGIRSQWSGLERSPKSQQLAFHLPVYAWQGSAGALFTNENFGGFDLLTLNLSYSYVIQINENALSIGVSAGLCRLGLASDLITTPSGEYEANIANHNDPILANQNVSSLGPKWGLGAYFISPNFEAGLYINQFPSHTLSLGQANFTQETDLNFYAEYSFYYSNLWTFTPSILIKSDFTQTQVDIFTKARYTNLFGGVGFRGYSSSSFDAVVVLLGVQFNKHYKLSYSYDLGISSLRNVHDGSHEFTLNYNLRKLIGHQGNPKIIYNPRY